MSSEAAQEWEEIYRKASYRNKNKYPDTEVVSWFLRTYGGLPDRHQTRLLDLGCGWGNNLKFFLDEGVDAWGVDGSETAVKHCKGLTANVKVGLLTDLPFSDEEFGVIVDRNSIHNNTLDDIQKCYSEAYRVLKSGGQIYSAIMKQTSVPQKHHAKYLKTPSDFLSEESLRNLLVDFSEIEIDESVHTRNGQSIRVANWHVVAKKG